MDPNAETRNRTLPDPFPNEFALERQLGAGTFGAVWLASDLQLQRPVAIKTLKVSSSDVNAGQALDCLRNEAQLLSTIKHPNLVSVYAWRTSNAENYLVLQYVPGGSLEDRVRKEGTLPWELAGRCIADVGEALLHVHQRGIVHRDVKPANILWDFEASEAVLADFGISTRLTSEEDVAGTPAFMAPEAYLGRIDSALDVYSLAATFFFLLTGEAPFTGKRREDIRNAALRGLPLVDSRFAQTPEPIEQWIRAGLRADSQLRPTLIGFVSQLRGILNQLLVDSASSRAMSFSTISSAGSTPVPAAVDISPVHLRVSRLQPDGSIEMLAQTSPPQPRVLRDLKRVPKTPKQVRIQTGEKVRFELMSDIPGYFTVINVGPTGNLNLLYPEALNSFPHKLEAGRWLHLLDAELSPPAGCERIMALWSDHPDPLVTSIPQPAPSVSDAYQATRILAQLAERMLSGSEQRRVAWLELNHVPAN